MLIGQIYRKLVKAVFYNKGLGVLKYSRYLALIFLLITSGCAYGQYFPRPGDPFLIHPLGMDIYNGSGTNFSLQDWERISPVVENAYLDFLGCVGKADWLVEEGIKRTPIIILPPESIEGKPTTTLAFIHHGFLFIRKDFFLISLIRHEWLHIYLRLIGLSWDGDPTHQNPIFSRCPFAWGY